MPSPVSIPLDGGGELSVPYAPGTVTFVVGANGTGKSALMVRFKQVLGEDGFRIVAGRPLVLQADAPEIPTAQAVNQRNNINGWDSNFEFRAKLVGINERAQLYLQTLSELESAFHRVRSGQFDSLDFCADESGKIRDDTLRTARGIQALKSPLGAINDALAVSGFLIQLKINDDGQIRATKRDGSDYGISHTSDGERAALVLLIETLAAKPGRVLLIDEPERHIHRALLHPLILELVRLRSDCSFVVSTHDIEFVSQFRAPVVLLRDMAAINERWVADLVADSSLIDDSIREDILGSRRRVLFVEGKRDGIDDRLYNLLFEGVSVIAKGGSRNVLEATRASNDLDGVSWLKAWGIIDRDGRPNDEVEKLRTQSIWPLPVYSIESIYFHSEIIDQLITLDLAPNKECGLDQIIENAVASVGAEIERLAGRSVEKSVRHAVLSAIPKWDQMKTADAVPTDISPKALYELELEALRHAISTKDWTVLVCRCPIRETQAPDKIAKGLGFSGRVEFEDAIRAAIANDHRMRSAVCNLLGEPVAGLAYATA